MVIKSPKCTFCETTTGNDSGRNQTGNERGMKVSISFVLFVIAFGFAHLLHQQILPFTPESFPYTKLLSLYNEDLVCQNNDLATRFGTLIRRLSNSKETENGNVFYASYIIVPSIITIVIPFTSEIICNIIITN